MSILRRRLILALLALGVALLGGAWLKVRQRPPDIIVVVGDSLRADRVGGGARPSLTPFLDELAAGGVRFTRAYATSSWTLPSIASLVTSRYPSQHGVNSHEAKLRDEELTINERLREVGYTQVGFTANFRLDEPGGFAQGYNWWFPYVGGEGDPPPKAGAAHIAAETIAFIDDVLFSGWRRYWPRAPFLFYFQFMEPHAPYLPPQADVTRLGVEPALVQSLNRRLLRIDWAGLGAPEVATLAALYDAEVASLDAALRDFFTALGERGFLDRAIVVVTADHGEEFREHGKLGHGLSLFDEVLHVPLLVRAPGITPGTTITAPVSLLDIAPTLLDLLGLPPEPRFVGRSRAAWLRDGASAGDDVLAELLPLGSPRDTAHHRAALLRGTAKVIAHRKKPARPGIVRLAYDLAADPREQHPIALDPALAAALDERIAELSTAAAPPVSRALDEVTRDRLRALGYAVDSEPPPR